jgi:hypothetical protein
MGRAAVEAGEVMTATRLLVTGSRHWTDEDRIRRALDLFRLPLVVVHGDCATGADAIVKRWAIETDGAEEEPHPADWTAGRKAGPDRNQMMVDLGGYFACLAFPMPGSRGTYDCIRRAEAAGIPVINRGIF